MWPKLHLFRWTGFPIKEPTLTWAKFYEWLTIHPACFKEVVKLRTVLSTVNIFECWINWRSGKAHPSSVNIIGRSLMILVRFNGSSEHIPVFSGSFGIFFFPRNPCIKIPTNNKIRKTRIWRTKWLMTFRSDLLEKLRLSTRLTVEKNNFYDNEPGVT